MKTHPSHTTDAWGEWNKYAGRHGQGTVEVAENAENPAGGSGTSKGKSKETEANQTGLKWEDGYPYILDLNAEDMPSLKTMKGMIKTLVQHHFGKKFI
jgi:hypothetical protein